MAHEHDFDAYDDNYFVEWGENGDVVAYIDCTENIITASYTDSARDEVYEESRSCLGTLTRYWSVNEVLTIDPDGESPVTDSEAIQSIVSELDLDEEPMEFVEFGNVLEEGDEIAVVVEYNGDEYQIVYELVEVNVND